MELNKVQVDRVRRKAYRHGFRIEKSRQRSTHRNNVGGLMLIESWSSAPLAGWNFELDTAQAEYWINRYASEGRGNGKGAH